MQRKENISEELRQVSGVVADISRTELFEVPQGYFEGLAGKIMERIGALGSGEGLSPVLLGVREQPLYAVPEGYFEGFAAGVLAQINARHAGEPSASEELAGLSPFLSSIGKKTPFQAPEGYLESLSPLLAGLKDKPVYQAPEGYLSGLADTILARLKEQRAPAAGRVAPVIPRIQAPVIAMGRGNRWLKYAAAAIVAGLIFTAGWLGFHKTPSTMGPTEIAGVLSRVSDQEIQSYLDDQDDHSLADGATNSPTTLDLNDIDIKDLLGDVPDNELKMYLEEHSASKDAVTN